MSDLVERLKANPTYDDRSDAADLIETQAARIAELEAALRFYADDNYNVYNGNGAHARAALEGRK